LGSQPHFFSGTRVHLTNYAKPQKSPNEFSHSQQVWSGHQTWNFQPVQHELGSSGPGSQGHLSENRSFPDVTGVGFELASSHASRKPTLNSDLQNEQKAQRHFKNSVKFWAVSQNPEGDFGLTRAQLQIPARWLLENGFDPERSPQINSEIFCGSQQNKFSLITFNSSQGKEISSVKSEMPVLEAVNLTSSPQGQIFSSKKLETENSQLDPNLRFNLENTNAFIRRTSGWPVSLHN
jgi:hypothetical protein